MEERINDIVSQEAIEQLVRLSQMLDENTAKMSELIRTTNEYRVALGRADGAREQAEAVTSLNDSTNRLISTQSERLNIEREIKAEGQKMKQVLESEAHLWQAVDKALAQVQMDMGELVSKMIENRATLTGVQNSIKGYRKELVDLKKQLKENTITQEEYDAKADKTMEKLDTLIAKEARLKQDLSEQEQSFKSNVRAANAAEGSYDAMSIQLGKLRDSYRQLSEAQRNDPMIGGVLLQGINQLDEELKALDKTMGNNQRNVGNYEIASKSIRSELMNCRNELMELNLNTRAYTEQIERQREVVSTLAAASGTNNEEYEAAKRKLDDLIQKQKDAEKSLEELRQKTAELTAEQKRSNAEIQLMANPNAGMDALVGVVNDCTQAFTAYKSIMLVVGAENEDAQKVIAKLVAIQQVANSVQRISNSLLSKNGTVKKVQIALEKFSINYKKQLAALETKHAAATAAQGTAATGAAAANTGLAVSFRAVGAAIKAIPGVGWILAIASALVAVGAAIKKMHDNAREQGIEELNKQLEKTKGLIEDMEHDWSFMERLMKAQGRSEEAIMWERYKVLSKARDVANEEKWAVTDLYEAGKATREQYDEAWKIAGEAQKKIDEWYKEKEIFEAQKKTDEQIKKEQEKEEQERQNHEAWKKRQDEKKKYEEDLANAKKDIERQLEDLAADTAQKKYLLDLKRLDEEEEALKERYKGEEDFLKRIELLYKEKRKKLTNDFLKETDAKVLQDIKDRISDEWNALDAKQKDEINKAIIGSGGALSEQATVDLQLKQIQDRIDKMKELEQVYKNAGISEEEYTRQLNELLAQQAEATKRSSDLKIEAVNSEREAYIALAESIMGSISTIGNAIAEGVGDQVTQVRIQQALAMAQLLLSQGVSLANAIEAGTKEGASKGSVVAMYAAIATAVGAVIGQIINAKNAIDQAKTAVAQAEAYAEGTDHHHGGPAIVGEGEYPELVMANGKSFVVDKPTYFKSLPVGAKVKPITPDMYRSVDLTTLEDGVRRLNDKSMVNINVGENVYAYIVKGASRARMLNRSFMH